MPPSSPQFALRRARTVSATGPETDAGSVRPTLNPHAELLGELEGMAMEKLTIPIVNVSCYQGQEAASRRAG